MSSIISSVSQVVEEASSTFRGAIEEAVQEGFDTSASSAVSKATNAVKSAVSSATASSIPHIPEIFTPGILSALIVTLILLFILITAITWLSSLDISYGSFEKKVDHKKAQ